MNMDMNRFSTPINKTAALVTQQFSDNDIDTLRSEKISILKAKASILEAISDGYMGAEEKQKNKERVYILDVRLVEIKERVKAINVYLSDNKSEQDWILKECASMFSKDEWKAITHRARQKKLASEDQ